MELHHTRSPRASQDLSGKELQLLHEGGDGLDITAASLDPQNLQRHGDFGGSEMEGDIGDGEGDDSLEDDMMDKISSSPSIDDGGCHSSLSWSSRGDSRPSESPTAWARTLSPHQELFPSPCSSTLARLPISFPQNEQALSIPSQDHHHHRRSCHRHQEGGYGKNQGPIQGKFGNSFLPGVRDRLSPLLSEQEQSSTCEKLPMEDSLEAEFDPSDFHYLLVPADDPLLDNSFDDAALSPGPSSLDPNSRWNAVSDQGVNASGGDSHGDDDDDNDDGDAAAADIFLSDDRRFIDSGWGGECLREIEDIDFEFVYALHTFVATVEGQANATKGETMVLLDDSNSYWWLVRVGKDGSIGEYPFFSGRLCW